MGGRHDLLSHVVELREARDLLNGPREQQRPVGRSPALQNSWEPLATRARTFGSKNHPIRTPGRPPKNGLLEVAVRQNRPKMNTTSRHLLYTSPTVTIVNGFEIPRQANNLCSFVTLSYLSLLQNQCVLGEG